MSHERPSKEIKYMPHISLQSNIQAFKKLTVIFPQPSQMKCKVEKRLSPRDPKCGFYRTVWTSVSHNFWKEFCIEKCCQPWLKRPEKVQNEKEPLTHNFFTISKQTENPHTLPFLSKEGGLRVEPEAKNDYLLALRPNHRMHCLCDAEF